MCGKYGHKPNYPKCPENEKEQKDDDKNKKENDCKKEVLVERIQN